MLETPSLGAVLAQTGQMARATRGTAITILLFLTIAYVAAELTLPGEILLFAFLLLGIFSLYLQLRLTAAALSCALPHFHVDRDNPTRGRLPSMFLLSILWTLGVTVGLLFLIIPGFILMVRWTLSVPVLLAEDTIASTSLDRSWNLTRSHWRVAAMIFVIGLLPMLPAFVITFHYPDYDPPTLAMSVASNLLMTLSSLLCWLLACGLYASIRPKAEQAA